MQTGNFGKVREAYVAARQDFPLEVIEYIWQYIETAQPKVLDIGCGTGIATRQLAQNENASIIGCDVDEKMIQAAQQIAGSNSRYYIAPTAHLPFSAEQFEAVTSFSAFHWFTDNQSLNEIKRVLKKKSQFFVINKNDVGGFKKDYKAKLAKLLGKKLPSPKEQYDPAAILEKAGFTDVVTKVFLTEEDFSVNSALQHIQSSASWAEVPPEKEQEAVELMKEHIFETMTNGQAVRQLEVVVVRGKYLK